MGGRAATGMLAPMGLMSGNGPLGRKPAGTFNFEPPPPGRALYFDPCHKRVRVVVGGETIADSKHAKLLREAEILPAYYFPKQDVRTDLFVPSEFKSDCPVKGEASYWSIQVGDRRAENAAWSYTTPRPEASGLKDYFAFDWPKMDKWMEEEEELFKHARDPYKRVDVMPSKRHVRVVIDGHTVAETRRPHCSSKPIIRCATTSRRKTCAWTCSPRAQQRRAVRIRDRRPTGR